MANGFQTPDHGMAERHLTLLDESAEAFTFQTFDDNQDRRDDSLTRVINSSLDSCWDKLVSLSARGAGVFVTVNATDLKGRSDDHLVRIRSVWQEADRGDEPDLPCEPHFIIESSPNKYHRYILTDSLELDEFNAVQRRLVDDYGSDPNAKDRTRVLRLAGFPHQKVNEKKGLAGEPFMVQIIHESGEQPFSWSQVKEIFPPVEIAQKSQQPPPAGDGLSDQEEIKSALDHIDPDTNYSTWMTVGMALHDASGGTVEGLELWDTWSAVGGLYRPGEPAYRWGTFSSFRDSRITLASLYKLSYDCGWKGWPPKYNRDEISEMISEADVEDLDRFMEINQQIKHSGLSKVEVGFLHKRIKDKSGIRLTDLRADMSSGNESEEIDQQAITVLVLQEIGAENLIYATEWFYLWNNSGVWHRTDDRRVKQSIHYVCDQKKIPYTSHLVDAVTNLIKTESYKTDHQFDLDNGMVNCLNGELMGVEQVAASGQDSLLADHKREHYRTTQIPVAFDPDASAPRFEQFLGEVFAGDPDAEAKQVLMLELIGYTLHTTCRYEKFVMLIGSGANGKSVLLGVLEALLGHKNICAVQPSRFDNPFNRAHLHGKLANIITEIAEGAEIADAALKAIVSGELTTAEHKMKPPFDFHPFATCWFGTNHMPHTRDFSDALFRRAVILEFNNKFEGDRCDPHLKEKLLDELPGILNLSINAYHQMVERGAFSTCESNERAKHQWRLEADQVAQFIEECCAADPHAVADIKDLYDIYGRWATGAGIRRTLGKRSFGHRLDRLGFAPARTKTARIRKGIRIVDNCFGFTNVTSVATG